MQKNELLKELLEQAKNLPDGDDPSLDALLKRSEMIFRNLFGESSKYLKDLDEISFHPMVYPADAEYYAESWARGKSKFINLLETMSEELALFDDLDVPAFISRKSNTPSKPDTAKKGKVFIVHGHDNSTKNEVVRFIERFELEAVVLHEKASSGNSILEKFSAEAAKVDFAVILLTGDDRGAQYDEPMHLQPRARQNVILEMGYFLGSLTSKRVVALKEEGVELPSDYSGIVYINLDSAGGWMLTLAREFKAAGFDIDLNRAI